MIVFITGANGLIGSYICRHLLEHDYHVRALKRPNSDLSLLNGVTDKIEWIEGDILDPYILEKAIEGVEWVIHCAAYISYESKDQDLMYRINVGGTANVVDACLNANKPNLLHISSVATIGRDKNSRLIDETYNTFDLEHTTGYAKSKYLSELEVWRGTTEGLNAVIVNPSLVIGPGDWTKSSTKIFKYVWDNNRFYTKGLANLVDVRDLSEILLKLMEAKLFGERFIISADSISYKKLFGKIADAFEKKAPDIEAKGGLIQLATYVDKLRALLTGKPRFITDELKQVASNEYIFDSTKVKSKLGVSFRKTDDTILWCCKQIMQNLDRQRFR